MVDTMTIVSGWNDESTGYYINGELEIQIHTNDINRVSYFFKDVLLDESLDITKIREVKMSEEQVEVFLDNKMRHPSDLKVYESAGEFDKVKVREQE